MEGRQMVNDMLTLIDINQIKNEGLVPYDTETIRRYFRRGILYPHQLKDGTTLSSYRGSVIVRYSSMERVKAMAYASGRRLNLDAIGNMFRKAAGEEDDYIVSLFKEGKSVDEIRGAFTDTCWKQFDASFLR
jgi:hypothetical protein